MVTVSVVVPVFNTKSYLKQCLSSIADQAFENFEIIIIDNNSSDGSSEIIAEFCLNNKNARSYICVEQGVSHARNLGLDHATGDYILLFDSDDIMHPDMINNCYNAAKLHNADIICCNFYRMIGDSLKLADTFHTDRISKDVEIAKLFNDLLTSYIMYHSKFFLRSLLTENNIKFDSSLSLGEDVVFNIFVYKLANTIVYISRPLYYYRIISSGLNLKFRPNLIQEKSILADIIRNYLISNNQSLDNYYVVLFNDIFSMMVNTYNGGEGKLMEVVNLPLTKDLLKSGVFKRLIFTKKIVFLLIKFRLTFLIGILIGFKSK